MRIFRPSVEAWRSLVTKYAAGTGMPVDFLLAWIDKESGGQPCNTTSLNESGIFQVHPDEAGYIGGDFANLRNGFCSGGTRTRTLTDAEKAFQVTSGIRLVQHYRDRAHTVLHQVGAIWSESSSDFWKMVKQGHALPIIVVEGLPWVAKYLGHAPHSWSEFTTAFAQMPASAMSATMRRFYLSESHDGRANRLWDTIANADSVGGATGGFALPFASPGMPGWFATILGVGIAVGLWKGAKWYSTHKALHA